jgi:adenylate cyclase
VEIAATAFANLLEDRPLTPLDWPMHVLIVFAFGLLLGLACVALPVGAATICVLGSGGLYLCMAWYVFNTTAIWIPVVIPLFMLMPVALVGTVVCRYCVANREREGIRKAFGYFLPDPVIDQLAKNLGNLDAGNQVVYGICLYTDAQQYAALSETMDPKALSRFMNRYYERLFVPVRKHGGIVSDVVGDSMMAIWAKSKPDASLRAAACHAALGIVEAIRDFNLENDQEIRLHTRIGMHAGHILVGNIGAVDHYEYRPVGDIVNTRLTDGRHEQVSRHADSDFRPGDAAAWRFLYPQAGSFLPFGKSNPVVIHELLGYLKRYEHGAETPMLLLRSGNAAYRMKHWDERNRRF